MAKNVLPADAPAWLTKDRQIKEVVYCCDFLSRHPMKCIHGKFFTVDGMVPDEGSLKREIFDDISEWKDTGVARKVEDLLKSIKMMAYAEDIPLRYDRIHVANGTWYLDGHFSEDKEYCRNRLDVAYNPSANAPEVWLSFLKDLLEPEDIPTLQEYLGYCLIPSTKAQKMLMLIGKGGEGKSRIGLVMRSLMGINMNMTSIQKIETRSQCLVVRPCRTLLIVGGNPTWKGANHSTISESWSRSGNARFKRRQQGNRDGY